MAVLVGLTGGIGAGKSVVARCLRTRGFQVIDTDSLAKFIMDSSPVLKTNISATISDRCVADGVIDRKALAEIVFAQPDKLRQLNAIVHRAVKEEIQHQAAASAEEIILVETAIFYQSGLNRMCAAELRVTAPEELRITRVMQRNGLSESEVKARIEAQQFAVSSDEIRPPVFEIINDGRNSVLAQLDAAMNALSRMAENW